VSTTLLRGTPRTRTRSNGQVISVAVMLTLIAAALLRFWQIAGHPGYDWDEPVYTNIATNLAHHGTLQLKPQYGQTATPYLFHPPFYFLLLAGWFKLVGAGVTQARIFAASMSLVSLALMFFFLRSVTNRVTALVTVVILSFDGWMVFTNRVSWIENTQLVLIVGMLWAYQKALQSSRMSRFAWAGILLGAVVIFKHLGLYMAFAVLLNWVIVRRNRRGHKVLFVSAAAVVAVYFVSMLIIYARHGHDYFWDDTLVQVRRTFGLQSHRGTINSPGEYVGPLVDQYRVFLATVVVALASAALIIVRVVQCIRQRSFAAVSANSLLFSWAVAAVVCFGAIDLKFPHYFLLVLIPLVAYLTSEATNYVLGIDTPKARWIGGAVLGLIVVLGLVTFQLRIVNHHDNALEQTRVFATTSIPADAVVITEETVGTIIPQQYCN
jgi:4-amino-4-deoxy-L-arabinose transferase-like glycosyltransferase